jgi:pimeloyl-ACP methyl ester carboxylesterase
MLPVVLAHGYLGFASLGKVNYFEHIIPLLKELGAADVFAPTVEPKGSLHDRASELMSKIMQAFPGRRVHVIAHSMGGLDARFLLSKAGLGGSGLVDTLTTLGTPHQGTILADLAVLDLKSAASGSIREMLRRVASGLPALAAHSLLGAPLATVDEARTTLRNISEIGSSIDAGDFSGVQAYARGVFNLDDQALRELTTDSCGSRFPVNQSDVADTQCYSYAGITEWPRITPFLTLAYLILQAHDGLNDGLVPAASATLQRTPKANISTDHIGLIGHRPEDVTPYYRQIMSTLRARA